MLHLVCACGHAADIPAPSGDLARATVLARARCHACGRRGAAEMRLIWINAAEARRRGWL